MKKAISILAVVFLVVLCAGCLAEESNSAPKTGTEVATVFAAPDIQPYTEADGSQEKLDTIWIYYTDGTFEQFAEVDDKALLFSNGTYELVGDADFVLENNGADNGQIIIRRETKLSSTKGLEDFQTEDVVELSSPGLTQLYAPDAGRKIDAAFYGIDKQPYTGNDGEQDMLDTWWLYFSDGTFEQYAIVDDEPKDRVVLFSTGRYQLRDGSSFIYEKKSDESSFLTIQREKKLSPDGLVPYESSHEYELSTLGFVRIISIDR